MKIQPLADRIVVKVLEAKEVTKGGIVLPDTAKEKPQEAEVVAVGKGKEPQFKQELISLGISMALAPFPYELIAPPPPPPPL